MQAFLWVLTVAGALVLWLVALFLFAFIGVVGGWTSGEIPIFWSYLCLLALPGLMVRLRLGQYRFAVIGVGYAPLAGMIWMLLVGVFNELLGYSGPSVTYLLILLVCFVPILLLNLAVLWKRG